MPNLSPRRSRTPQSDIGTRALRFPVFVTSIVLLGLSATGCGSTTSDASLEGVATTAATPWTIESTQKPVSQPPSPKPRPDSWRLRARRATKVAEKRPGSVSFAVADRYGNIVAAHNARNPVSSASVIKSMFLVAYLRQPDVANRKLTEEELQRLTPMITRSLDDPATETRDMLGWNGVEEFAEVAGMVDFSQDQRWGLSQITAADMARFFSQLPRLLPPRHRDYALGLLGGVIPQQQWGIPPVTPNGWTWHIKGGWINRVVNQVALVTKGRERLALAVLIEDTPGTEADVQHRPDSVPGPKTISKVANELLANDPGGIAQDR